MKVNHHYTNKVASRSTAGFTLLELLIVATVLGILSAIAAPNWTVFISRQRLNTAQNQVYRAMQAAKSNAVLQKATWNFSIREVTENDQPLVQWAIYPQTLNPALATWQSLESGIQLYAQETTLYKDKKNGIQQVQFNYIGNTNGQLGQLTLTTDNTSNIKRCVYVSTLIGTLRMGQDHPKSNDRNKYCY